MKKYLISIAFFISLLTSFSVSANDQASNFRLLVGAGEGLGLGSIRFGFGSVDFGLLNKRAIGATTYFYSGRYYANLGPVWVSNNSSGGLGLFGAIGTDFKFFNFVYIKTELNSTVSINNYSYGSALVALGIYW